MEELNAKEIPNGRTALNTEKTKLPKVKNAEILFDVEKYKELWSVLDREDRARLLFLCDLPYKQRKAITLLDNSGYSSKEATEILGFADTRSFERLRAKALKRVLNILNSRKHNQSYSLLMPKKKKRCKSCR